MMLARVGFGDGILVPFAQIAVGQWRVDSDVMPGWVCNPEVAGQVGAGLELRVLNSYSIAIETDYTALYREQREPQDLPFPRFWGAMTSTSLHF
jgi:hypothetical protein